MDAEQKHIVAELNITEDEAHQLVEICWQNIGTAEGRAAIEELMAAVLKIRLGWAHPLQ